MSEPIREGFDVFVHDGDKAFGTVRQVHPNGRMEIVVYVESGRLQGAFNRDRIRS